MVRLPSVLALSAGSIAITHGWISMTTLKIAGISRSVLRHRWGCNAIRAATFRSPFTMSSSVAGSQRTQIANAASSTDEEATTTIRRVAVAAQEAVAEAFGPDFIGINPMVTSATREEFGDYQCNVALSLAKPLKQKPQEVAKKLTEVIGPRLQDICMPPEIAGPGFINLRLKPNFIAGKLRKMLDDPERLAIPPAPRPQRVIVDFSSPNIAKEMHVGHLRSTIIGDTLCKVLELRGHDVLRLNHVGDWGTQFGMLIAYIRETNPEFLTPSGASSTSSSGKVDVPTDVAMGDLVALYRKAKQRFDEDESFKERSRQEVVRLQRGDEDNIAAWRILCELSRNEFQIIYDMLNVQLQERGESFYNPFLPAVVNDLEQIGALQESEGARVVYVDGYEGRDGAPSALLVQKTDGGFLYATTDLAALRHRASVEQAERILYVTDAGQSTHFDQVFRVARQTSLVPASLSLEHVPFGLVQGEDGKKFKTRSGETVRLRDLLDEAVKIASEDIRKRWEEEGREVDDAEIEHVARVVGIGAVKYADLSMNRESNYRFSYKKMLSLQGNTAPYMLYAYARIQGISRKAAAAVGGDVGASEIILEAPEELGLARQVIRLSEVVEELERDLFPSKLCEYIFDLSARFNRFYEACPVNSAPTDELLRSRTALCAATAAVLRMSLGLLGIETVERL